MIDEHFGSWALRGNVLLIPEIQLAACNELNDRFVVEVVGATGPIENDWHVCYNKLREGRKIEASSMYYRLELV